jgi:hypothetical protein
MVRTTLKAVCSTGLKVEYRGKVTHRLAKTVYLVSVASRERSQLLGTILTLRLENLSLKQLRISGRLQGKETDLHPKSARTVYLVNSMLLMKGPGLLSMSLSLPM